MLADNVNEDCRTVEFILEMVSKNLVDFAFHVVKENAGWGITCGEVRPRYAMKDSRQVIRVEQEDDGPRFVTLGNRR